MRHRTAALIALAAALSACGGADKVATAPPGGGSTAVSTAAPETTVASAATTSADGCQDVTQPAPSTKQFTKPPTPPIPTDGAKLTFETTCGSMTFVLDSKLGGAATDSVAGLASAGFYDNLTLHRVVPNFVLQGGDPLGNGMGGPGYTVTQAPPSGYAYKLGDLAMAKAGSEPAGAAGSQFFVISGSDGEGLPPDYAIVGHSSDADSLATIARIAALGVGDGPPSKPVVILHAVLAAP